MFRFRFLLSSTGQIRVYYGIKIFLTLGIPFFISAIYQGWSIGYVIGRIAMIMVFSDVTELYQHKARNLILTVIGGGIAIALGGWISDWFGIKILVTFLLMFVTGYLTIYGEAGTFSGLSTGLLFLFSLYYSKFQLTASLTGIVIGLIGVTWGFLICLGLWIFRPLQPVKEAIALCYQELSAFLKVPNPQSATKLRGTIEKTRQTLGLNRLNRMGYTELGAIAVVLIEECDRLITLLITIIQIVDSFKDFTPFLSVKILVGDVLNQIKVIVDNLSKLIATGSANSKKIDLVSLTRSIEAIRQQKELNLELIQQHQENYPSLLAIDQLVLNLTKIQHLFEQLINNIEQLKEQRSSSIVHETKLVTIIKEIVEPIKSNFTFQSKFFRHGIRLGFATSIGILLSDLMDFPKGFWIAFTIILVLRADIHLTFQRFFHRVLGTILGVIITPLILLNVTDDFTLQLISIIAISVGYGLVRYHYGMATFFISIFAIINVHTQESNLIWVTIGDRLLATAIGSGIAILSTLLLFYDYESIELTVNIAKAIDVYREYFKTIMAVYLNRISYNPTQLNKLKQQTRLAYYNAQATIDQYSQQPSMELWKIQPSLSMMVYLQRFGRILTLLMTQLDSFRGTTLHPDLSILVDQIDKFLINLIQSLQHQTPIPNLPDLEPHLNTLTNTLKNLQQQRLMELNQNQKQTPTVDILRDYSLLGITLIQLVDYLNVIRNTALGFRYNNTDLNSIA